jgi:hypothetical protein
MERAQAARPRPLPCARLFEAQNGAAGGDGLDHLPYVLRVIAPPVGTAASYRERQKGEPRPSPDGDHPPIMLRQIAATSSQIEIDVILVRTLPTALHSAVLSKGWVRGANWSSDAQVILRVPSQTQPIELARDAHCRHTHRMAARPRGNMQQG